MNNDLISRIAVCDMLHEEMGAWGNCADEIEALLKANDALWKIPAADVAPVVHGEWELHGNDDDCGCSYFCNKCGASYDEDWFYDLGKFVPFEHCPNCGADMRERKGDGNVGV